MSAERRLDDAAAALGRARLRLDDLTRARVAARLEAAIAAGAGERAGGDEEGRRGGQRRRARALIAGGGVIALGVAAAAIALVAGRGGGERAAIDPTAGGIAMGSANGSAMGPAPGTIVEATSPARLDVPAGESRRIEVGGTAISVFGPGHLDASGRGAATDAAALVVDRPRGDAPWSLRHGEVEIVATRATFAVDRGRVVRVMVLRGEITLRCDAGARQVRAGESATCAASPAGASPPIDAGAPSTTATTPIDPAVVSAIVPEPEPPPGSATGAGPRRLDRRPNPPSAPVPSSPAPVPGPAPGAPSVPPPSPLDEDPLTAALNAEPTASSEAPNLYALAEGAMRRGDHAGARAALQAVIDAGPDSLDAALALLDLARLAHADHDDAAARSYLRRLDRHPHRAAVAAPAASLRAQATGP